MSTIAIPIPIPITLTNDILQTYHHTTIRPYAHAFTYHYPINTHHPYHSQSQNRLLSSSLGVRPNMRYFIKMQYYVNDDSKFHKEAREDMRVPTYMDATEDNVHFTAPFALLEPLPSSGQGSGGEGGEAFQLVCRYNFGGVHALDGSRCHPSIRGDIYIGFYYFIYKCVPMRDISIVLLCQHTNPALRTPTQSNTTNYDYIIHHIS